jgi:hypothetical protein
MLLLESVLLKMKLSPPFRSFLNELLLLLLIVPGRATFRNLSRYSAYVEKTFSRWFRRKVDWAGMNVAAIRAVVPAGHESVLAFDPSYVPKSGDHTEGLGHFWNGSAGQAERGLEVNALSWVDVTANTAYTISAEMTPPGSGAASSTDTPATADTVPAKNTSRRPKKAKAQAKPRAKTRAKTQAKAKIKTKIDKTKDDDSRVDAYLAHLNRVIPQHHLTSLRYLTADGYFSKVKFVDGVVALKLDLISKLRRDADARYLYTGPYVGRGAPRRYAGKVDWTQRDPTVFTRVVSPDPDHLLETAVVDLPRLRRSVRVVVVIHRRTQRIALLFSTDLDLDPVTLYRYYKARFQIEFLFRDSKQFAGLTHCQARRTDAITFHVNASLTAVSLSKLQAVQALGHLPTPFSMASLVRRAFNEHFLKKILAYLAKGQTLEKNSLEYETLCNYGIINPVLT